MRNDPRAHAAAFEAYVLARAPRPVTPTQRLLIQSLGKRVTFTTRR